MFDNISSKIQTTAKIIVYLGIAGSVIGGIALLFCSLVYAETLWFLGIFALIFMVFGCFMTWLFSILLHGFGKLIEDIDAIRYQKVTPSATVPEANPTAESKAGDRFFNNPVATQTENAAYCCPVCKMSMDSMIPCERCGYTPSQFK